MPALRVLHLSGSQYDMGYQHGLAYRDSIREIAAERIHLSTDETWTGRSLSRARVLQLAEECIPYHEAYSPEIMDQLEGMSAATGLTLPELVIANGFTDFADVVYNALETDPVAPIYGNECTAWMTIPSQSEGGAAMLTQTWDMHATATPYVILLHAQPEDGPQFLAFTLTGCVAMIGMNSAGIAVSINNLAGADGQPGVTWPIVCRKILMQRNIEDALACITEAQLAGGHNYLLLDSNGRGYNVEAMSTATHITELSEESLVHANMCLNEATRQVERPLTPELEDDSRIRATRARNLLNVRQNLTPQDMMEITRNRDDAHYSICALPDPPFYSETCGAVVMRPATRDFWGVWGLPKENPYEHFQLPAD